MKLTHKEVSELLKVDESKEFIRKSFFDKIIIPEEIIENSFNKSKQIINTKWCNCENKDKGQVCPLHHADVFFDKNIRFQNINVKQCEHKNIKREDGLDECLDCGIRNY